MSTIKNYGCATALSVLVGYTAAASSVDLSSVACILLAVSDSSPPSAQSKPVSPTHSVKSSGFLMSALRSNANGLGLVSVIGAGCGACTFIVCFATGIGVWSLLLLAGSRVGRNIVGG